MVEAAVALFRERGYDGAGFRDIVARAGAARGAIYHHFPEGKPQLGEEVATAAGGAMADVVEEVCLSSKPVEAVSTLVELAARLLVRGPSPPGCPVAAVALSADDPEGRLRDAARVVFSRWQDALRDCLVRDGIAAEGAAAFATVCVAAVEGAVVLCRAERSERPLELVERALLMHLEAMPRARNRATPAAAPPA
jgi:AcrR family transcriptional regulator